MGGDSYRYHPLFRDFLLEKRSREAGKAGLKETYERLAEYFRQRQPEAAITCWLQAGDYAAAEQGFREEATRLLRSQRLDTADRLLQWAIGSDYRGWLDRIIPGAYAQILADADTVFAVESPSLGEWRFTREDARRITQPVLAVLGAESGTDWAGWPEVQARVREWLPQSEPFVLAGSNHALEEKFPRAIAAAMATFLATHPIPVGVPG